MKQITVRLQPNQDLRKEIEKIVAENHIRAGVILAAVGGLQRVVLRTSKLDSGEHPVKELEGPFEIVSCMGTLSPDGCHVHLCVSDRDGACYGGHLKAGSSVFVTVELVIGVFEGVEYRRIFDQETGYPELSTFSL
jgi:predicted DNA-binding protein with PD1-like motif